jgi:hypothetical protein
MLGTSIGRHLHLALAITRDMTRCYGAASEARMTPDNRMPVA